MVPGKSIRARSLSPITNGKNGHTARVDAGLLVLDMSLRLLAADEGALSILHGTVHNNGNKNGEKVYLPKHVLDMLANQGNGAGGKLRVSIGDEHYLCRTFFIQQQNGATGEPSIALYLHRDTSFTDAINDIAAEYHLSDREQQALRGIAIGLSAKEMADQMDISPNTVKSFLRIVMIKLGVGTRAGILGRLLEHGQHNDGVCTECSSRNKPEVPAHG
jgi:DNA-binding CsgD family transcriptional regulator